MKLSLKNLNKLPATIFSYWLKYYKLFFILLFLLAIGYGTFIWYETFYRFSWSEEKKQQYTLTQNRNVNLKEKEFDSMIEEINKRKQKFDFLIEKKKDIFKSE